MEENYREKQIMIQLRKEQDSRRALSAMYERKYKQLEEEYTKLQDSVEFLRVTVASMDKEGMFLPFGKKYGLRRWPELWYAVDQVLQHKKK